MRMWVENLRHVTAGGPMPSGREKAERGAVVAMETPPCGSWLGSVKSQPAERERAEQQNQRKEKKEIHFLYIFIVQNNGQKHLTVWRSPAAGIYIKPTSSQHKSRMKLETCLGINVTDPALGAAMHMFSYKT